MRKKRRTFRRGIPRIWIVWAAIAVLILLRVGYDFWWGDPQPSSPLPLAEGLYDVIRIVDGDTLVVCPHSSTGQRGASTIGNVRLRLLGIDCPEITEPAEPFAREAFAFTTAFVADQPVRIRFDKRRIDADRLHLAYLSVGDRMLNEELLRNGLARLSILPGDSESIARRLRAAEQEARDDHRGIRSAR